MLPSKFPEVAGYPNLAKLLEAQVDMQFADLRTLLRLPMDEHGLHGGANYAATMVLCNIIAGSSVLFYRASIEGLEKRSERGERFKGLMASYYPWCEQDALRDDAAASLLWDYIRAPLSHTLGVEKNRRTLPGAPGDGKPVMLAKSKHGLPDNDAVDRLLDSEARPDWYLDISTIAPDGDGYTINIEMLAWGVHQMLRDLLRDTTQVQAAEDVARHLLT